MKLPQNLHTSLALFVLFTACRSSSEAAAPVAPAQESLDPVALEAPATEVDWLETARQLGVSNPSMPEPWLLCSGQLDELQFGTFARSGYKSFINLRTPGERGTGWEAEMAASLGVSYLNLPVAGAAGIDEANARLLASALAEAERPVALYCGSSNRAGALYGLSAFYTQDKSAEESLALAQAAGMTSLKPRLMQILGLSE